MALSVSPDLSRLQAHWLAPGVIALPRSFLPPGLDPSPLDWSLHWSASGGIDPWAPEPLPWATMPLRVLDGGLPSALAPRARVLTDPIILRVPASVDARTILRGQVAVVVQQPSGRLVNACGVQHSWVLDDLYRDAGCAVLGATFAAGVPTLRVWAPTALTAELLLWRPGHPSDGPAEHVPLTREPDGCWSATGDASWVGARYLYAVTVYTPEFGRVVENRVTDPYSVALTTNSRFSVIADLADPGLAPPQWRDTSGPVLESLVDQVIYELHVRDFSRADASVPEELRGTYLAFAEDSQGARHLRRLAEAGITTVQLLPVFDCTSIEEDRDRQSRVDRSHLRSLPSDSDDQQRHVVSGNARRAFNWGYDPWHYMAPEGSYATPGAVDGPGRTRELRTMVGALHALGLRVVLDQVYNHTTGAGQASTSVVGRLVPGYYHRRDAHGTISISTCCPTMATEHLMAEKLMVDSCVLWAKHYRIDGFRFDLMGHHSRDNVLKVRAALDALTPERDGVDGRSVTLHGEGWSFGEVADNALFVQAAQGELGGTHIATFSDRLRDAVRGGSPFDDDPRLQGFGSGLLTAPNASIKNGNRYDQRDRLLYDADLVQVGLAGTLRDFTFLSALTGRRVRGDEVDYHDGPAGYADEPDEAINYVDAHDNETLFDALTLKLPMDTPMRDRVRANTLCLALATLGQNPVMWHAGSDFLRSKSLDRNSYDSGDWFNFLDFSLTYNGFGAGLPPASDNRDRWPYMRPLLALPELSPGPEDLQHAHALACDVLRLRASTRLFRLGSAAAIRQKVSFPASGTWQQVPGTILYLIDDTVGEPVDQHWRRVAVVFNGAALPVRQSTPVARGAWQLHPVQAEGADPIVKTSRIEEHAFAVPGRTAAVFVEPR